MTRIVTTSATPSLPPLAQRRFVLATDLDGTFLGGTEADRLHLYRWIEANRAEVGLIFVTGRDPRFIGELCAGTAVPWPDLVIGDVGTTVAGVDPDGTPPVSPIADLEADIAHRWADSGPAVERALHEHPGLTRQATDFRHRLSYDLDPATYCDSAEGLVADLGLDHLISDNRFFDVLPRGISKGPTLRRVIAHLAIPEERVLAAGDTLNDLSMLNCGLKAVAVGGSEPDLLAALHDTPAIHRARGIGAAGILEAIDAFGLFPSLSGAPHAV
jgi:hypothetical protein